ncbi:MAG: sodium:proton antiporter [Lachnospiraceae bacterium]|nr:sodium:proton antiporter [Lachnospiraceae bacterium]
MAFIWNFPLFTIVLSLFSGALCMVLRPKAARYYTIIYQCFLIILVSFVLWFTVTSDSQFTYSMGEFPAPWGNEIRGGVLESLVALAMLLVLLASCVAGWHFLKIDIDESKINLYFSVINLITAALMSLVWTNDIFTGYVFLEILTLSACGITIVREVGRTTLAAVKYMILNLMGSGLFLLGVVLLYDFTGQLLMVPMKSAVAAVLTDSESMPALTLSVAIMTIGLGIKSGLFPFHFWMPDSYGWSTPASAAILSSLVSKAYIFLLIKIYYRAVGIDVITQTPILKMLFVLGICGIIFGSVSATSPDTLPRMIGFSSAAQIGYIYMGIGIGTHLGFVAALFQLLTHMVTKALVFLAAPYLEEASDNNIKFIFLQGAARRDRTAGLYFTFGALSMVGIPCLGGFAMKLMYGQAAISDPSSAKMFIIMITLAASSFLNTLYFIRTVIRLYSDPEEKASSERQKLYKAQAENAKRAEGRRGFVIAGAFLMALNLFLGLFPWIFEALINQGLAMFS